MSTSLTNATTPNSSLFLAYYLAKTGPLLSSASSSKNPYLTHLVALAARDTLVMHCLTAMGGAHLDSSSNTHSSSSYSTVRADAARHYYKSLRGLREALAEFPNRDPRSLLGTLVVVILMAQLEVSKANDSS